MEALLQGVLDGNVPVKVALDWALAYSSIPYLADLHLDTKQYGLDRLRHDLPFRAVDFRTAILNYVREQAELILAAAEQETSTSPPSTPETKAGVQSKAVSGTSSASSILAQRQQRHQAQLLRASRRLEPGRLDDENFPSLGAPASKPSTNPGQKRTQVCLGNGCVTQLGTTRCSTAHKAWSTCGLLL